MQESIMQLLQAFSKCNVVTRLYRLK